DAEDRDEERRVEVERAAVLEHAVLDHAELAEGAVALGEVRREHEKPSVVVEVAHALDLEARAAVARAEATRHVDAEPSIEARDRRDEIEEIDLDEREALDRVLDVGGRRGPEQEGIEALERVEAEIPRDVRD